MTTHLQRIGCAVLVVAWSWATVVAGDAALVRLGAGSYATQPPPGAKSPPATIYRTADLKGPMPTCDWWSSLAWIPYSEPMYAHPLVLKAQADGLRVWHPAAITTHRLGLFASMPGGDREDLVLAHSRAVQFPDARVAGFSDWFVTAAFEAGAQAMRVSFGHGSPFVYATYQGGEPVVRFGGPPRVWSGDGNSAVLGITVGSRHYGLFGPGGSRWQGLGTTAFTCATGGKTYFSLAALPDDRPETLALFQRHAYAHVTGTRVEWSYTPENALVTTRFTITTRPMEGPETGTLFALYPHQWRHTDTPLSGLAYACVRGPLKLAVGNGFRTQMDFPGILPVLPNAAGQDAARLRALLEEAAAQKAPWAPDTYWDGKNLGRLATLMQIARQTGADEAAREFRHRLRHRLETWLSATAADGQPKTRQLFFHDANWGALIGSPASFGSDTDLNDHAFHYGYFVHAAAALAFEDEEWARAWGPMVELLAGDMACADRHDPRFPFLRAFDPYAGHSWASGTARFADGNNQESSSEAMNAWAGLTLWGEATGNASLRDLGAWLFTTELAGVEDYWFDVTGELRPKEYQPSVVTMVWGGKGVNETWFSPKPEDIHMINWLPFTGASLYLGRYPEYVRQNYEALRREVGGEAWRTAADLILMYRALDDPDEALRQYQARAASLATDSGNSQANVLHWISNLRKLGQVDRSVTANHSLVAVFRREGNRSYVAYNPQPRPRTVRFSDGMTLDCPGRSMLVRSAKAGDQP